ncbi:hypothetical protein F5Y00DRAFT_232188 [Daldinia vernicosa]|uniref:uncharacterized protein n=1 Tax=Daldinia vernicosa TaxID=114800 RepID=UPI002008B026|nr:uncharacterized protein F5Y00DRAFT_232188 [Daldinia vernicosa]KAI0850840.1 hypothetical protein F5Y00DRAFT_232188 [Daldinia vernicosa]
MDNPYLQQIPQSGIHTMPDQPQFSDDEKKRYSEWATPLTRVAMGLAHLLPEVDGAALVEFIEFPKIWLALSKFKSEYWSLSEYDDPHRFISSYDLRKAAVSFQLSPVVDSPDVKLRSLRPTLAHHHIANFMREVFAWTVLERADLAIRRYLLPGRKYQLPILIGTLAAYLFVSANNPMYGNLVEGPSGSSSQRQKLPVYPEWRARHNPNDPEASRRLLYLFHESRDRHRVRQEYSEAGWLEIVMRRLEPEFLRIQNREEEKENYADRRKVSQSDVDDFLNTFT